MTILIRCDLIKGIVSILVALPVSTHPRSTCLAWWKIYLLTFKLKCKFFMQNSLKFCKKFIFTYISSFQRRFLFLFPWHTIYYIAAFKRLTLKMFYKIMEKSWQRCHKGIQCRFMFSQLTPLSFVE